MLGQRVDDGQAATHYRSDRISSVNGQYFFSTREGTLEGPYFTRRRARSGAVHHPHAAGSGADGAGCALTPN